MSNFNYCNYIGEHMSEPLEIEYLGSEYKFLSLNPNPNKNDLICDATYNGKYGEVYLPIDKCEPRIKSPSDLTDDELAYFLYGKELPPFAEVCRIATNVWVEETIFGVTETVFKLLDIKRMKLTQNQWNRLYSLHVYLDYEELIRARKAVRKI